MKITKLGITFFSNELVVGAKVQTTHNTIGEIIGIYGGRFPYVVRIIKEGMPYLSDYSSKQLDQQ